MLALASALVTVEGETDCPTPAAVSSALESLSPAATGTRHLARLARDDQGLHIELVDEAGHVDKTRTLEPAGSCADLAGAAAIVISAWEGELERGRPPVVLLVQAPRPRRVTYEVGGGFAAALTGRDFAPGGIVEVRVGSRRGRFGGRFAFTGTDARELALGNGHATWTRFQLALGPQIRFRPGRFMFDLHADGVVAVLMVSGVGFGAPKRDLDVDPGLGGGVRAAIRLGPVAPFLGVNAVGWLRRQLVGVTGLAQTAELPRYDLSFVVGLAFGTFL